MSRIADNPPLRRFYWRWEKALLDCLPEVGSRVLVGISGGCDSVLLAWLLRESSARGLCHLVLGHVNHGLREEADQDEGHVRRIAAAWKLELRCETIDPVPRGPSVEQAARHHRHAALRRMAEGARCRIVALGHQMDDQAETVLFRLLRGTGPRGLGAMAPASEDGGITLIRPLLGFRRRELREVAREAGLDWTEDASNRDPAFLRNRLRHELLPLLSRVYNPRLIESLAELARQMRLSDEPIRRAALELLGRARLAGADGEGLQLRVPDLSGAPEAVATRALYLAYQQFRGRGDPLAARHMRDLWNLITDPGAAASEIHLPGPIRARRRGDRLVLEFHPPRPDK